MPTVSSLKEHMLYKAIHELLDKGNDDIQTIDECMACYICDMFDKTNRKYFIFLVKFVLLFRDYICNIMGGEFAKGNKLDGIPEFLNSFLTEFMEGFNYFGLSEQQFVDISQHFAYWLYEREFTTLRLRLDV
jgi:hypothetical protein